jgi:type IX secretion system PorP/SprF family membrane protein
MKRKLLVVLLWPLYFIASGQQDAQFSQNMFNKLAYNPGFAGMNHGYCVSMIHRSQWVGFPGAPVTTGFNANALIPKMKGGLGFTAFQDKLGNEKNFAAGLSASHHINMFGGEVSLGARLGWMQKSFHNNWIATDGVPGDNSIPVNAPSLSYFDLGAGAFYLGGNGMYLGLSMEHAYNTDISGSKKYFKNVPHYYVTAGTKINLPWVRGLSLRPSVLAKSDGRSTIFDINLLGFVNDRFWLGGSYRMTDAMVVMGGVMWNRIKIGYSYDITTSAIRHYSSNSHELLLSYCHPLIPKMRKQSHINPRKMEVGPTGKGSYYVESNCDLLKMMGGEVNWVE